MRRLGMIIIVTCLLVSGCMEVSKEEIGVDTSGSNNEEVSIDEKNGFESGENEVDTAESEKVLVSEPTVYAYVSVDINPSVELAVSDEGDVMAVEAVNEDAEEVIEKGMVGDKLDAVLDKLTENAKAKGLLKKDGTVLVTSALAEDGPGNGKGLGKGKENNNGKALGKEPDKVEARLMAFMEKKQAQYEFLYYKGTSEEYRAAKSNGLSLGKYTMMKFLGDVTKEEIKAMKMAEIAARKEVRAQLKAEKGNVKQFKNEDD